MSMRYAHMMEGLQIIGAGDELLEQEIELVYEQLVLLMSLECISELVQQSDRVVLLAATGWHSDCGWTSTR